MISELSTVRDVVSGFFMLSGSFLALVSAIGLYRLGSTRARMHATTKPATLGVLMVAIGASMQFTDLGDITKIAVVVVLQLVTAPIGAHMLGRAVGGE
ncbi:MAG: cation:proton antiporter [Ilumatobacteraceae bacterium]